MGTTIDYSLQSNNGSTNIPVDSQYNKLLALSPDLVKEMGRKSIDVIVWECGIAEGRLHLKNKQLSFSLRELGRNEQQRKVEHKINEYNRFSAIVFPAIAGGVAVLGGFLGGAGQVICSGISTAVQGTGDHWEKKSQASLTHHSHVYDIKSGLNQEHSQDLRQADQSFDRGIDLVARAHQSAQRAIESLASAA